MIRIVYEIYPSMSSILYNTNTSSNNILCSTILTIQIELLMYSIRISAFTLSSRFLLEKRSIFNIYIYIY